MPNKDLGSVPLSSTQANTFLERICLQIKLSTGTVYLTNAVCSVQAISLPPPMGDNTVKGYNAVSLNLDGTARWYLQYGVELGEITESTQDGTSVSWVMFDNLAAENNLQDRQFTKWANSPGLRKVPVDVYSVHFNPTTGAYLGSYLLFPGEFDGGEFGPKAQLTLKQRDTPWRVSMLHQINGTCASLRNYKQVGSDCGYAGPEPAGQLTCSGSIGDCLLRGNQARHNGFTMLPKPGTTISWPR
jgi:hypothetical protein